MKKLTVSLSSNSESNGKFNRMFIFVFGFSFFEKACSLFVCGIVPHDYFKLGNSPLINALFLKNQKRIKLF